jgi:hypothetical protein
MKVPSMVEEGCCMNHNRRVEGKYQSPRKRRKKKSSQGSGTPGPIICGSEFRK